jgi:hypothetical protein
MILRFLFNSVNERVINIYGAVGGMKNGRGNRSTRRMQSPLPRFPPKITHDLPWDRTRADAVGGRRLTAWTMVHIQMVHIESLGFIEWKTGLDFYQIFPNSSSQNFQVCDSECPNKISSLPLDIAFKLIIYQFPLTDFRLINHFPRKHPFHKMRIYSTVADYVRICLIRLNRGKPGSDLHVWGSYRAIQYCDVVSLVSRRQHQLSSAPRLNLILARWYVNPPGAVY